MKKRGGSSRVEMGKIWGMEKEEERGDSLHCGRKSKSNLGPPRQQWCGWGCSRMHMCVLGLGAGRQAQINIALNPRLA